MYLDFWNLREHPFQNVEDARFAYLSDQHHEGLARLIYLVENHRLGGVLTGPYGVGKTMVLELLGQQLRNRQDTHFTRIDYHPSSTRALARYIFSAMGYEDEVLNDVSEPMDAIRLLQKNRVDLRHNTLVIDEAQAIRDLEVHHFLHLLMNITLVDDEQRAVGSAFTIILSGYSDMTELLAQDESLCQRLQMLWQLEPLSPQQVAEYVQHRMRVAGGDIQIFEEAAIEELARQSEGLPRQINNVCDIALMLGYAANIHRVDVALMQQAATDARFPTASKTGSGSSR